MEAIFKGDNGLRLSLTIERYQSDEYSNIYDGNWLVIRGVIETPEWKHEFLDPCLLSWEYTHIAQWLRTIESADSEPAIGSTDNLVEFYKYTINGEPVLLIRTDTTRLRRPDGLVSQSLPDDLDVLDGNPNMITNIFPFRLNDFREIAAAIESQLEEFPVRDPEKCQGQLNRPFYLYAYNGTVVHVVPNLDGTVAFAATDQDTVSDWIDDASASKRRPTGWNTMSLDELRDANILTSEEIETLLRDGKIEL